MRFVFPMIAAAFAVAPARAEDENTEAMTVRSLLAHDFVGGGAIPRCVLTEDVTGSAGMGRSRVDYRWHTRAG
jgi:hypothetical protein